MVDHLAYGDIIRIYCTLQDIQDKNQKNDRSSTKIAGFLLSKGFADNNIYFLKSKKFTEFEFRNSLFEILPYSSFEIHDENRDRLKNQQKNPVESGAKNQDDENIKSRMETEKEQFKNKTSKNRGLNINFDSEVVIRHVNSESFLQGEFSCPETGIGSFKLVLTNEYSSLIKFKIIRFRNSDKEAQQIQSKDEFRLHHCASHCFLNIGNQDDEVFLDKPLRVDLDSTEDSRISIQRSIEPVINDIFDEANMYHNMRPMIKKPTSTSDSPDDIPKRYEVVNQSKATLILNFMPEKSSKAKGVESVENGGSKKEVENEQIGDIEHNDIIYLKNTKNDSFLTVDMWTGDVYLKQDKNCYEGLWQVCVRRETEKGSISSNSGRTFYLKHYITDAIAKVGYDEGGPTNSIKELSNEEDSLLDSEKHEAYKHLESCNKNLRIRVDPRLDPKAKVMRLLRYPDSKGSLKHRDLVVLSVMTLEQNNGKDMFQSRMDFKKEQRREEKLFIDIADPIKKIFMTDILKESEKSVSSYKLKLCKGDIENTFQIFKFDQKKLPNINKILSCQEAFAKFCDILIVFNKLLKRNSEVYKGERRPEMMQSEVYISEAMTNQPKRPHRNTMSIMSGGMQSPKQEEGANTNTKEDPIEQFFNKFLNSYILLTVGNTTRYLIKNSRTGSKIEFDFIIMIRSLGVIEILIEILYFIEQILSQWEGAFKGNSHSDSNISKRKYEKDRLSEIFKDVYQLLIVLSNENSCKIYMARWLGLFLKQYYKLKKEFMHEFILQVLQDSFIIKNCIKSPNIQECMDQLRANFTPESPEEKYLQLLSSFCRAKNSAVPVNQKYIMDNFLKPQDPCVFRFELKKTDDDQQNQDRKSSIAPKEDIKIITKNKDKNQTEVSMTDHNKFRKKELWTYTVTLLNLFADVSFDQPIEKQILHRQSKDSNKSLISVGVVSAFFKNYKQEEVIEEPSDSKNIKTNNNNIFEPFLKLAHYYIKQQTDGPRRLERNETVIVWKQLKEGQEQQLSSQFNINEYGSMSAEPQRDELFQNVIAFFTYLFERELGQDTYSIKRLRTIETSLDLIKTIMRTQSEMQRHYEKLINSIIMSVLKLKSKVIYNGIDLIKLRQEVQKKYLEKSKQKVEKQIEPNMRTMTIDTEEATEIQAVKQVKDRKDIFGSIDKAIESNYKKMQSNKEVLRLLIDTRRAASEILDIYLDIRNNQRLEKLVTDVFLKLYKNDFDTGEDGNDPYSHRYKMTHEDTWVKEIVKTCDNCLDRLRDVRCLIECIFVDSLKVVDKMIVLMFKMYESRKLLLNSFSNTFICYEQFYVDAYNEAKAWMASFEKIKQNGNFSDALKTLQGFSYMIRNPQPKVQKHDYIEEEKDEDASVDDEPIIIRRSSRREFNLKEQKQLEEDELIRRQSFEIQRKKDIGGYTDRQTLVLNERETKFNQRQQQVQKLFINIKIHEFVIKYAKSIKMTSKDDNNYLNIVYEFLTLLVFDNARNKKILSSSIESCERHIKSNYKALDFLREMIRNNKTVLFNKETISRIVRMVLDLVIQKDDYILKAKLMEVLRVCCMYNNKIHTDNQTIIMSLLQNKKYFDRIMFSTINYSLGRKIQKTPQVMQVFEVFQHGVPDHMDSSPDIDEQFGFLENFDDDPLPQQLEPDLLQPELVRAVSQAISQPELLEPEEKPIPPSIYTQLTEMLNKYNEEYRQLYDSSNGNFTIDVPELLQYLISYFSTMTALVDENHKINVGKCSNIHPYETLIILLDDCDACWPLARYIRAYINRLYYGNFIENPNEPGMVSHRSNSQVSITREFKLKTEFFLDKIFEDEVPLLEKHMKMIANQLHDSKNSFVLQQTKIKKPVRYEYIVSYLYMFFVETLSGLNSILSSQQFKSVIVNKLKELKSDKGVDYHCVFGNLLMTLGDIYKRYRHNTQETTIKKMLSELFELSLNLIEKLDITKIQFRPELRQGPEISQSWPEADPDEERKLKSTSSQLCQTRRHIIYYYYIEEKDDRTNKRDTKDDADDMYTEEFKDLKFNRKSGSNRVTNSDEDVQLQVNQLLESVINKIKGTEKIKQMVEDELNELVELCCDLDCKSNISTIPLLPDGSAIDEPRVLYKVISQKVFLEQVIKLVTKSPVHLQTSVKIKTIRFLRLIFQKKVNSQTGLTSKRKWESSYFKNGRERDILVRIQTYFLDLKLGQMIVKILETDSPSYELLEETFMIGVRFLFNGNTQCQESILVKLKEDSENQVMTQLCQFIRNIRHDIETQKFKTEDRIESKLEDNHGHSQNKITTLVDSYNYYDKDLNCMMQARQDKDTTAQSIDEVGTKIRCICQAYNFLQLLCENDNTQLKDFLRQQINVDKSTKYNSVNFLAETTKLFKIVLEKLARHEKQKELIKYIAEFVIQVTQIPCITNQRELCNTSIFQDIRSYIEKEQGEVTGNSSIINQSVIYLMDFVINVGLSLLEGNEDSIYDNLLKSLNSKFLSLILVEQDKKLAKLKQENAECPKLSQINEQTLRVLMKQDNISNSNKEIRQRLEYVFNLLALIKKLSHYQTKKKIKPTLLSEMTDKSLRNDRDSGAQRHSSEYVRYDADTVKTLTSEFIEHIQVAHNGKKQYLYFPKLPIFSEISAETKDYITENVKRDTQIDKITDFLSKSSEVNNEMNWNYKVQNRLNSSSVTLDDLRFKITVLTLFIEVIFIVFSSINFTLNHEKKEVVKMIKVGGVSSLLHLLAIIQLFSSVYFLYVWTTLKYRLAVEREVQKNKTDLNVDFVESMLAKIDKDEEFDLKHYWYCAKLMYQHQPQILNTLFFVGTSFSGYLFGYEYYSLMVFDILSRNKTLKNVIQAITLNMKQLFYVSLLILVFVYVFNMISIEFDLYLPYIYEAEEEKCEVLSDCIMSLYTSGIVGTKDQDLRLGRYFTDLIYIVIMELLFSNIVSGIMIDTFAQLRDHRKTIQNDQQNQCFICGITKATIEKRMKEESDENSDQYFKNPNNKGIFYYHTHYIHKQWNYIYYLYILRQKDITAYTGIQYAIKKQLDEDQFKWVPIEYQKNENDVEELLDLLSVKLKKRLENPTNGPRV